jgi:hypothetical protein
MDCAKDILLKRRGIEILLSWAGGAAETPEVNCQYFKPVRSESQCLLTPALLVESTSMGEHDSIGPTTIDVGADSAAIVSRKRDRVLRRSHRGKSQRDRNYAEQLHAAIIGLLFPVFAGFSPQGESWRRLDQNASWARNK